MSVQKLQRILGDTVKEWQCSALSSLLLYGKLWKPTLQATL